MITEPRAPSAFSRQLIRCECGNELEEMVASGLHVSERPELRKMILAGELHHFRCPDCARVILLDTFLPYTDFPRRQLFLVTPTSGLFESSNWLGIASASFEATMTGAVPRIVYEMGRGLTRRVVFGLASLREKLIVFDAGLDDRLVELLKIQLLRDLGLSVSVNDYFFVSEVTDSQIVFARSEDDGPERSIREMIVPRGLLDELEAIGDEATSIAPFLYDSVAVDHRLLFVQPDPDQ